PMAPSSPIRGRLSVTAPWSLTCEPDLGVTVFVAAETRVGGSDAWSSCSASDCMLLKDCVERPAWRGSANPATARRTRVNRLTRARATCPAYGSPAVPFAHPG